MYLVHRFQQMHAGFQNRHATLYSLIATCIFLVVLVALPLSLAAFEDNVDGLHGYPLYFCEIALAAGLLYGLLAFLVYRFSSPALRTGYIYLGATVLFAVLAFGFVFQTDAGVLDNFIFANPAALLFSQTKIALDCLVALACLMLAFYLLSNHLSVLTNAVAVLIIASLSMSAFNLYSIHERISKKSEEEISGNRKLFSYSKQGKNVVLLFVDGAMSGYMPDILNDDPSLAKSFNGFSWYSNVVSTGNRTINGLPALFGGFDYTVSEINKRPGPSLEEKVSNAYKLYADNFSKNDYQVLYSDPFWFGFQRKGDCEKFNDLYEKNQQGHCIHTIGKYVGDKLAQAREEKQLYTGLAQQYLGVSLFKIAPSSLRQAIYANGEWLGLSYAWRKKEDKYLKNYFSLDSLGKFSDTLAKRNTFTFISNELTRAPLLLNGSCMPDSTLKSSDPAIKSLMQKYSTVDTAAIYQTTKCTVQMVGQYMEWLKTNGIYDNTMVVVASDHGWVSNNPALKNVNNQVRYSMFQSFLMIKDLGDTAPLKESKEFISNASVPGIICDVLGGCVDRATGKTIHYQTLQGSVTLHETPWQPSSQNGDSYVIDAMYRVKSDVTKSENWERMP
jgi:hypothetical protein